VKINDEYEIKHQALPPIVGGQRTDDGESFADLLAADALKAKVEAERNAVLAAQPAAKENEYADDIEQIKAHGFSAYAEEVHKKKLEELREKLLEMMGLTEEDLEAMPAEQRSVIEDMISREIQARLAVESMTNGTGSEANAGKPGSGQIAAEAIAGANGKLPGGAAGAAVMAVLQAGDLASDEGLPGERLPESGNPANNRE
jgi:hypothetical protein